ncbi:hypothetical protein [Sphingobacterium wenxiniae]|uniref:Uncharacterized protein n=1 Tax=Sphingobacterium wenxiniae TaxID=683125 RepID=A0A1I6QR27_9SPHI|nr:hypothetical protein [Sphingobacterium wenxiniae]SFS54903.1 hypothetical protein SAMN05660206_102490 [Sphingobacterium wenxiniae]
MKKFHPFFTIGTVGMIVTACLHMFLALSLSLISTHAVFFTLYPAFLTFMILGVVLTVKKQKTFV